MIRRKACLIADASINLEKEIQKQVDLLIIREDLVAVWLNVDERSERVLLN